MNKVEISGRLVADPEVRYSNGENATCIARFRVAVNRRFKREGEPDADFISCVAFGKSGEFIEKYFTKGMKIEIVGRIQTGSYTNKDGQTVYTTEVVVEEQDFGESKNSNSNSGQETSARNENQNNGFMNIPPEEDLPFAPVSGGRPFF